MLRISNIGGRIFDVHNIMPEYFASSIPLFEESIRASGVAKAFSKGATSNEIAINMLKQKLNHRLIAQATGLSTEQITKLENK